MTGAKRTAIIVAVLFIVATAASIIAALMTNPILANADYLGAVLQNANTITVAVLCMFIAALAIVGIPITLLPIFKQHNEALAYWYFSIRAFEAIIYFVAAIFFLSLASLAQELSGSTSPDMSTFEILGSLIRKTADSAFNVGTVILFSISAVILSVIFYQSNLVPRWLSVWKFIGGLMLLAQGLLVLFDAATPTLEATLFLPIALNEMVLALWLIFKGFNASAYATLSGD